MGTFKFIFSLYIIGLKWIALSRSLEVGVARESSVHGRWEEYQVLVSIPELSHQGFFQGRRLQTHLDHLDQEDRFGRHRVEANLHLPQYPLVHLVPDEFKPDGLHHPLLQKTN